MANNQKANIKDSSEGEGRGGHESGFGEKCPAGRAADMPDTKGALGATVGPQSGEIGASIGRTESPSSPETKGPRPVKPQPVDIGGVGVDNKQSPTARGVSAGGDEIIKALKASGQNGGDDAAAKEESRAREPTETEDVSKLSGVAGGSKADEEDMKSSARVLDQEESTRGRGSGPLPQQLPNTKETSPEAMACEPGTAGFKSTDIEHNSGTSESHDIVINGEKHKELPVKRVSFAPEPSESNSREKSTTNPETKELEEIADAPDEFEYNIGTFKGHGGEIDENQLRQSAEAEFRPAQKPGDKTTGDKRQNQPAENESDPTQQPRPNPETQELERIADVVGEFGYNIGAIKGHDRAIDNRRHDNPTPKSTHALANQTSGGQLPDVGSERTPESWELGNITIDSGEFGYNVGGQPSSHPGRHKTRGAGTRGQGIVAGSGTNAEISEDQRPNDTTTATPATQFRNTNGSAASKEFGSVTTESGAAAGHSIGGLPSSYPGGCEAHRQRPSERPQGVEGIAPEVEELGRITMDSGEFGYNVGGLPSSHPDRHRRHSHGRHGRTQASQETSGSRGLGQIKFSNGEFGHKIGGFEQRQRGKEKEPPTAPESRHRNKQLAEGGPGHTSNMRDSEYYGHSDGEDSHFMQAEESQQQSPFTVSEPSNRPTPPQQPGHTTEVIELENPVAPPCHQSQTITTHELRTALADFKSDLITSITTEFQLRKTESDPDLIRKQLPNTPQVDTGDYPSNRDVEPKFVKAEAWAYPEEVRSEKSMGRMVAWRVIGVGVLIALGLAVLWESGHFAIGLGFREGVDWQAKFAEWLFKEGKKGSS